MGYLHNINAPKAEEVSKVEKPEEKKDYGQELLDFQAKAEEQKTKQKIMRDTFGVSEGGGESLTASIVNKSIEQQTALMNQLNLQIAQAHKDLLEARKEREQAQTQLYTERVTILQEEKKKLDETAQQAKSAGVPHTELQAYKNVKAALKDEIDELKKSTPSPASPIGMSDETQIRLTQMQLDQQRLLTQMQLDHEARQKEWDLKMAEFNEASNRRWAEYKDSKDFREKGMEGFSDIAAAVASGVSKKRATEAGGETVIKGRVGKFPCQFCKTPVTVEPGSTTVKCPNEECGAEYEVRSKE